MTKENENLPAKRNETTVDIVLSKIKTFQQKNELDLPPNYSAPNALKSAWLIIQETQDRNKKPALSVCTQASVANALLDMVVQGLNPAKKQCYFIVYGNKLMLQRSYMGAMAVCKQVDKTIDDIYAEVIYAGDELEYEIKHGRRIITTHKQKFGNIDDSKVQGAYAVVVGKDGDIKRSELMTIDQLKRAWSQSQRKPIDENGNIKPDSTHGKFTAEMAKKTVINRISKRIINSSADENLLIQTIQRNEDMNAELAADVEVEQFANTEIIDIDHQVAAPSEESVEPEQKEQESVGMADSRAHPPADVETESIEENPY